MDSDTHGIRLYYCGVNVYYVLGRAANCDCGGWGGLMSSAKLIHIPMHTKSRMQYIQQLENIIESTELHAYCTGKLSYGGSWL